MRILFDTNVLYAAFTTKGFCEDVMEEAAGSCEIIWSQPLQAEFLELLHRRHKIGPGTQAALAAFLTNPPFGGEEGRASRVISPGTSRLPKRRCCFCSSSRGN